MDDCDKSTLVAQGVNRKRCSRNLAKFPHPPIGYPFLFGLRGETGAVGVLWGLMRWVVWRFIRGSLAFCGVVWRGLRLNGFDDPPPLPPLPHLPSPSRYCRLPLVPPTSAYRLFTPRGRPACNGDLHSRSHDARMAPIHDTRDLDDEMSDVIRHLESSYAQFLALDRLSAIGYCRCHPRAASTHCK